MLFSARIKLAEEYQEWLRARREDGVNIDNCPLSLITFLDIKSLLKDEEGDAFRRFLSVGGESHSDRGIDAGKQTL